MLRINDDIQYKAMEAGESFRIEQGYLQAKSRLTVRVRKQLESKTGITQHFLQTKFKVKRPVKATSSSGRIIEVGTEINERDFKDFWKKAKGKLFKIRYKLKTNTHEHYEQEDGGLWQEVWEIDFFKTKDNITYFIMAEVELPEGISKPLFDMPDFIKESLLYRVPLGDSRFSNSRLGDEAYAALLYSTLVEKERKVSVI